MSDNIHINARTGEAAMVSLRENPWHGMGQVVTAEMTDEEVLARAGLDWSVSKAPVYAQQLPVTDPPQYSELRGYQLLKRDDTGEPIAVVNRTYTPFQNKQMVEMMRIAAQDTPLRWETAGALGDKAQTVWVLAALPELTFNLGNDLSNGYMLISNGHGNGRALQIMPTVIRVVCQNTLGFAEGGRADRAQRQQNADQQDFTYAALSKGYAIRHSQNIQEVALNIARAYGRLMRDAEDTQRAFTSMAAVPVTKADAEAYWEQVFLLPAAESETERVRKMREKRDVERRQVMAEIWEGRTNKGLDTADTVWSAYNAAVEFIDHVRPARTPGTRFRRAMFGSDTLTKRVAWDVAQEMVGV